MMYGDYDDDDSSSDASSDFLSPFAPFRRLNRGGARVSTPWNAATTSTTPAKSPNETLARVQDTSWIGASVSPIASFEDDEEDLEQHTAPYRRALQESVDHNNNNNNNNNNANERSALLGDSLYRIHPLWNEDRHDNSSNHSNNNYGSTKTKLGLPILPTPSSHGRKRNYALLKCHWVLFLSFISALHLSGMAIYDTFWWYHSYRRAILRGGDSVTFSSPWNWWWISPSSSTMTRFGALVPWKVLLLNEYWRLLASALISNCLYEWILVIWSWRALRFGRSGQWRWFTTFGLSIVTGQLWMMAWDVEGVAGCFTWGTCGVLCAVGAAKPPHRFHLYMMAIVFIIMALLEPNHSVIGITGSCCFGWIYYGAGMTRFDSHTKRHHHHHHHAAMDKPTRGATAATSTGSSTSLMVVTRMLCGITLIALWVVPVLWIALQFPLS